VFRALQADVSAFQAVFVNEALSDRIGAGVQ
jgi:hypothetical protein